MTERMTRKEEADEMSRMLNGLLEMVKDRPQLTEQFFRYAKADKHPESDEEKKLERIFFDM